MSQNSPITFLLFAVCSLLLIPQKSFGQHPELLTLFKEWRAFEVPVNTNGSIDYSKAHLDARWPQYEALREKLMQLDRKNWEVSEQVDWTLLWAEMNGYAFNHYVLKPWERDPAFYKVLWTEQSDVPAHEGPTNHAVIEWWQYQQPLNKEAQEDLIAKLDFIPQFYIQAKKNLSGNARELWIAGTRDIARQAEALESLAGDPQFQKNRKVQRSIGAAIEATLDLKEWLEAEAPTKTAVSGVGKALYSWYQRNVHLVPLDWQDEVMLLKRELARAWSSLALEEHKNRELPPLKAASSQEEYLKQAREAADELVAFLDANGIVSVKEYYRPALEPHLGRFIPADRRNFFWITAHLDPKPLYSHFYHWFELARMRIEPHQNELRKVSPLYNIFDSRNEGMATAVEEFFMQAGLYDNSPRSREIVYILIAQRAARGLGSLYAHANLQTMEEAGVIHSEYTPRGWMKTEKELLLFEQHLYMRQPGYGTSYITGKYLMEHALMAYAKSREGSGKGLVKSYFDGLNAIGSMPASLGEWELTGSSALIDEIFDTYVSLETLLEE